MIGILTILSTLFLVYHTTLPGIPKSISETSYLEDRRPWMFSLYCLLTGILLLIPWIEVTPETWQFLVFISCTCMIFAGATPFFRTEFEAPIHYVAGVTSLLTWIVWMIFVGNPWHLLGCVVVYALACAINRKNFIYWAEVIPLIYTISMLMYLQN